MNLSNKQIDDLCKWLIRKSPAYLDRYKDIMEVMYSTGCRVSEAVTRSSWTFTSATTWTVKPNKESWERSFLVSSLPQIWKGHFEDISDIIHQVNYRKFQYQINLMLRAYQLATGAKSINSHIFRHNYIRGLKDAGLTTPQIQQQIGHKSLTSTQGYLNAIITANSLPPDLVEYPNCPKVTVRHEGNLVIFKSLTSTYSDQWTITHWTSPTTKVFEFGSNSSGHESAFYDYQYPRIGFSVRPTKNGILEFCPIKWWPE
ncbi:MAG: site-specific integrase [Segetibacter sp.]